MKHLHIDFEAYCRLDITEVGHIRYSEHPTCEILMVGYAIDDGPVRVFVPNRQLTTLRLTQALNDPKVYIFAHNANFEQAIIENVAHRQLGWPKIDPSRYRCTAALASSLALPRSLEKLPGALKLGQAKYSKGRMLIKVFCMPQKDGNRIMPEDKPEEYQEFIKYCRLDVEAEQAVEKRLRDYHLSSFEQSIYEVDSEINMRGLPIDSALVDAAVNLVNEYTEAEMKVALEITGGIKTTQTAKLKAWIGENYKEIPNTQKDTLQALEDVPEHVARVIEAKCNLGQVAVLKTKAMQRIRSDDDRIKGEYMYHGATTGRWAGCGVQTQNLKRPTLKNIPSIIDLLMLEDLEALRFMYKDPLNAIANCIRGMICAPEGKKLIVSDYSSIEARVLPWLAGQESTLALFRKGTDFYKEIACEIFSVRNIADITSQQRFIGKTATLALGYQGGHRAFQRSALIGKVVFNDDKAKEIKERWRETNPGIVQLWKDVEASAIKAIKTGEVQTLGNLKFGVHDIFLFIKLPSGRKLSYPFPEIVMSKVPWKDEKVEKVTFYGKLPNRTVFGRISTYGGSLVENITQAVARDLLAYALLVVQAAEYNIVGHVHDEIITEVDEDFGSVKELEELMCTLPDWADGIPLSAEGYESKRYKK